MNTNYTPQDDLQLLEDAIANTPGARTALQARLKELPEATAEHVTRLFNEAITS